MIPTNNVFTQEITEATFPGRTYKINFYADIIKKNENKFKLTTDDALTIQSITPLAGFTMTEDGILSISYNTSLSGYALTQDERGVLSLSLSTNLENMDRISGYVDDMEAVIQAIYLILSTERYQHIIYSWDYGVELLDLYGQQMPYVISELPRRIKDALIQDDRITDVVDFEFEKRKHKLHTTFNVITTLGNISAEMEVAF